MKSIEESEAAVLLCSSLIHMVDESGEQYLYDWNLSRSLSPDMRFRVGECLFMGDVDCRCLYHRQPDGTCKRVSDGLVVTFSEEDAGTMCVSLQASDEELTDATYCAKHNILGVGCMKKFFFSLEREACI